MTAQQQMHKEPNVMNGVNVTALFETIDAVQQAPEIAGFQFRTSNRWMGGDHNRSTIRGFKGAREEHAHAKGPFEVDNAEPPVLLLRDFHAENLIWLPDRQGPARLGLLDFQDAVAGPGAYDLASLIADARRDVAPDLAELLVKRYAAATNRDLACVSTVVALLSVQRTLRILGIFARLCLRDGKAHYVDLIPRVWGQLETGLKACGIPALRDTTPALLPKPTPQHLSNLRSSCGLHPAL